VVKRLFAYFSGDYGRHARGERDIKGGFAPIIKQLKSNYKKALG